MKLAKVKNSLDALHLPSPNYQSLGKNILDYAEHWKIRETAITRGLETYIQIVAKNIEDTRSNVDSIQQLDEAIANSLTK
jgi:hypothetical protein